MNQIDEIIKEKKRIDYIDVVRGIAMLCIIAGHMGNNLIVKIVFTFHVPVFFIISGLFYRDKKGKTKDSIIKLIKPYIFTVLCVALLDCVKMIAQNWVEFKHIDFISGLNVLIKDLVAGLYGSGSRVDFLNIDLTAIGAIWFYLALIWALVFLKAILQVSKTITQSTQTRNYLLYVFAILLWLVGFFSAKTIWLPVSIQSGCSAVIFLVIGMRMKGYREQYSKSIWTYIIAVVLWGGAVYFSITNDYMSLVRSAFPNPLINIVGAIAASWFLFGVGEKIEHSIIAKPLCFFGKYSMVVLSFHLIELNIIPWGKLIHVGEGGLAWINRVIIFVVKIIWCYLGVVLARKVKALRWVYSIKE